jgi:hypothetical protein
VSLVVRAKTWLRAIESLTVHAVSLTDLATSRRSASPLTAAPVSATARLRELETRSVTVSPVSLVVRANELIFVIVSLNVSVSLVVRLTIAVRATVSLIVAPVSVSVIPVEAVSAPPGYNCPGAKPPSMAD